MYLFQSTVVGSLIKRLNRFVAVVEVDGQTVLAHVPNSGRMQELLFPGNRVILEAHTDPGRKTPYDLILAEYGGFLVSVDSRLPNFLLAETINRGELPGFSNIRVERREVPYGESRLDLKLVRVQDSLTVSQFEPLEGYAEIKSCTLVRDGVAMFPDAPTARGARHLRELIRAHQEGYLAYVIFLVQRGDAVSFTPNEATDPEFANTLRQAFDTGVQIMAYTCQVTLEGVQILKSIPIML